MASTHPDSMPVYLIYTNDYTCGVVSYLLANVFSLVAARIALVNLDLAVNDLELGLGAGALLFTKTRKYLAVLSYTPPRGAWPFIGLEVIVMATTRDTVAHLPAQIALRGRHVLHMCEYVHTYEQLTSPARQIVTGRTMDLGSVQVGRFFVYNHAYLFSTVAAEC